MSDFNFCLLHTWYAFYSNINCFNQVFSKFKKQLSVRVQPSDIGGLIRMSCKFKHFEFNLKLYDIRFVYPEFTQICLFLALEMQVVLKMHGSLSSSLYKFYIESWNSKLTFFYILKKKEKKAGL